MLPSQFIYTLYHLYLYNLYIEWLEGFWDVEQDTNKYWDNISSNLDIS